MSAASVGAMCGRFVSAAPADELARYFGTDLPEHSLRQNYNVAPTNEIYVVRASEGQRRLTTMRWGLVPFWAKDPKIGSRMINARSETVAQKPAFRRAFVSRRCLIPASGFYEWSKTTRPSQDTIPAKKTKKQPYYIYRPDGEPIVFAGLWESWRDKNSEGTAGFESCTILTCAPNSVMATIHDRMPVLVPPGAWDAWLSSDSVTEGMQDLLKPAPDSLLEVIEVSTQVNNVRNNGPDLVLAAKEADQGTIFG